MRFLFTAFPLELRARPAKAFRDAKGPKNAETSVDVIFETIDKWQREHRVSLDKIIFWVDATDEFYRGTNPRFTRHEHTDVKQ